MGVQGQNERTDVAVIWKHYSSNQKSQVTAMSS